MVIWERSFGSIEIINKQNVSDFLWIVQAYSFAVILAVSCLTLGVELSDVNLYHQSRYKTTQLTLSGLPLSIAFKHNCLATSSAGFPACLHLMASLPASSLSMTSNKPSVAKIMQPNSRSASMLLKSTVEMSGSDTMPFEVANDPSKLRARAY